MIIEEIRNIEYTRKKLRNFGIPMGICLGLLGALLLWRGKHTYPYFFALAALFAVVGLSVPRALKYVYKVWMSLAVVLSWVMTRVLLSVIFYVGVTPIGLIGRLLGKDFLSLDVDTGAETYWIDKDGSGRGRERYEQQF